MSNPSTENESMATQDGRVASPNRLSSQATEPQEGLGPTGFDPARIAEAVALVDPNVLKPIIKKAADEFYCAVLEAAEDYFRDNLEWNLRSHLDMLERENQRMRTELYAVDRLLGSFGLSNEARLEAVRELDKAKADLIVLRYEAEFGKHGA